MPPMRCPHFSEFKVFKKVGFLKFFARAPKFRKYEDVKIVFSLHELCNRIVSKIEL